MRSKHLFPLGILIALALLTVATAVYPGGSQVNANATGFDWKQNYLCNLFDATAVNGAANTARIIRYCGTIGTLCFFLAATPLHNLALTAALIFIMLAVLYIVIFVLKTRFTILKFWGIFCMAAGYTGYTMYYTRLGLNFLPTMQKVTIAAFLIYFLCLHYVISSEDFPAPAPKRPRHAA